MRRFFSGILAVIMLVTLMGMNTVAYSKEADEEKLNILTGLGIINETPSGETVTRLDFARYVYLTQIQTAVRFLSAQVPV